MVCAEEVFGALQDAGGPAVGETFEIPETPALHVESYQAAMEESWVGATLGMACHKVADHVFHASN